MRLTALDLTGFKSFAKHARLEFREGITAIVGPNGSGKSNIADAIRWVLGEQSVKTLRGKKSEDVIFSGSVHRGRLGMSEVSLTLSNDADNGPVDVAEMVITRQLTRAGESIYLVNNKPVRLLDVADLLAKAGLSQKTYTVIGQGMAEAFVNASPAERRAMFEDATGVTPLLLKTEQVERKLAQTKEHLLRAKDLLRELEPHLRTLTRQAARARSRQGLEQELRIAEEQWFANLWFSYTQILAEKEGRRHTLAAHITTTEATIATLRQPAAEAMDAARLPVLRTEIEKLQEEEQRLLVLCAQQGLTGSVDLVAEERHAREKERQKLSTNHEETMVKLTTKEHQLRETRHALRILQDELCELRALPLAGGARAELATAITALLVQHESLLEHLRGVKTLKELAAIVVEAEALRQRTAQLLQDVRDTGRAPEILLSPDALREKFQTQARVQEKDEQDVAELRLRAVTLEARLRAIDERLATLGETSIASGADKDGALASRLEEVHAQRVGISAEATALETALIRSTVAHRDAEQELDALRKTLHAAEEERHAIEVSVAGTAARKEDAEREMVARLGETFLAALRTEYHPPADELVRTLESTVRRLRERLGEIGSIDRSVLTEEADVAKRVATLRTQVRDLEKASADLREGLRELATLIHRQFSEGIQHIHETFNTYFRQIFGGGRASVSIVKPSPLEHALPDVPTGGAETLPDSVEQIHEDAEEGAHTHEFPVGVEIRATPPGKKLISVSQLSGGEKALTSIALLFAILSQRPSPFVVLDEVDAALDEANSRRFAQMLQGLAETTQFLVITHNRATMQAASALYGVTMGNDGISQLLSVKLAEVPENVR